MDLLSRYLELMVPEKADEAPRQTEQPATVYALDAARAYVEFDAPQRAVTPGQSAVIYDGDRVLGGGIIDELIRS